jgi:hypothetical protein
MLMGLNQAITSIHAFSAWFYDEQGVGIYMHWPSCVYICMSSNIADWPTSHCLLLMWLIWIQTALINTESPRVNSLMPSANTPGTAAINRMQQASSPRCQHVHYWCMPAYELCFHESTRLDTSFSIDAWLIMAACCFLLLWLLRRWFFFKIQNTMLV